MTPDQYRKQREKLGLTQAGLAALLGVPRETVSRRESGDQRITEEMCIALRALPRAKTKRVRRPQNAEVTDAGPATPQTSKGERPGVRVD